VVVVTVVPARDVRVGDRIIDPGGRVEVVYEITTSGVDPGRLVIAAVWDGRATAMLRWPDEPVELAPTGGEGS
jgi:hypothetical protein